MQNHFRKIERKNDSIPEALSYDAIAATAYKAPLNAEGIAVLPAEWDDNERTSKSMSEPTANSAEPAPLPE